MNKPLAILSTKFLENNNFSLFHNSSSSKKLLFGNKKKLLTLDDMQLLSIISYILLFALSQGIKGGETYVRM